MVRSNMASWRDRADRIDISSIIISYSLEKTVNHDVGADVLDIPSYLSDLPCGIGLFKS